MSSTAAPPVRRGRWRRIVGRIFLGIVLLIVAGVSAAAAYNFWAVRHYQALYPAPGKLYSVDGHRMHLYCTGAGSPTIVLEAGLGNDFRIWDLVQPELSTLTRVCSYDRAGVGWSDPRPGPRDSNSIAEQLHGLLLAAGIKEPVVLMGHSIAGLHLREYASKYPGEVVGMVLVDPTTPGQFDRMPPVMREQLHKSEQQLAWLRPLVPLGIVRLAGQCGATPPAGLGGHKDWYLGDNNCSPSFLPTILSEMDGIEASSQEVAKTGTFGDMQILIFSQDPAVKQPGISEDLRARVSTVWYALHEELKGISSRARRIVAKGSTHYVQIDRPDLLNREVPLFIRQIRGEAQGSDYGSTKVE
jgi:pimeloyl-ACP methyl ester carboxylesterase